LVTFAGGAALVSSSTALPDVAAQKEQFLSPRVLTGTKKNVMMNFDEKATLSWFNFVSYLPSSRLLVCGIAKNGISLLHSVLRLAQVTNDSTKKFGTAEQFYHNWLPENPMKHHLSLEKFKSLLRQKTDSSDSNGSLSADAHGWRKIVVIRDPLERFVSGYQSKCLLGDRDGKFHCHSVFKLGSSNISILNVARRLALYGKSNPHWAPQSSFCGNTVGPLFTSYTHQILFHDLSSEGPNGLASVFQGRVSNATFERIREELDPRKAVGRHVTNAKGKVKQLLHSAEVRALLFEFYAEDYRLFRLHSLLGSLES